MFGYGSQDRSDGTSKPDQISRERQEAGQLFAQLKPICVDLLSLTPSNEQKIDRKLEDKIAERLQTLASRLENARSSKGDGGKPVMNAALITYIFYPLGKMMREWTSPPDRVRERQFGVLACLLQDWWQDWTITTDDKAARERWSVWDQLLLLCAMALTRRDAEAINSEETIVAILTSMHNLLAPRVANQAQKTNTTLPAMEWEWDGEAELPDLDSYEQEMSKLNLKDAVQENSITLMFPTDAHLKHIFAENRCRNVLAHALTAAIDLSRNPDRSRRIRSSSLRLVRVILEIWVAGSKDISKDVYRPVQCECIVQERIGDQWMPKGQAERVSLYLPGVVSAVVRIATMPKGYAEVLSEALLLLKTLLLVCFTDNVFNLQEDKKLITLEDIIAKGAPSEEEQMSAKEHNGLPTEVALKWGDRDTLKNVGIALRAIHPIRSSENHTVQVALAELAADLLLRCWSMCNATGDTALPTELLKWLLFIASSQSASKPVSERAEDLAVQVLRAHPQLLRQEMSSILHDWPHLLTSRSKEGELAEVAQSFTLLLRLASGGVERTYKDLDALNFLTEPSDYERWTFTIISSIRLDSSAAMETLLRLKDIDVSSNDAVMRAFQQLGHTIARTLKAKDVNEILSTSSLGVIDHLLRLSGRLRGRGRDIRLSVNAALLARLMLSGAAEELDNAAVEADKKIRKRVQKAARTIISTITNIWKAEEDDLLDDERDKTPLSSLTDEEKSVIAAHADAVDGMISEYSRGLSHSKAEVDTPPVKLGPTLNVDFVHAATLDNVKQRAAAAKTTNIERLASWSTRHRHSLLLQSISYAAQILGQSVRPLLMNTIYPMISALASNDKVLHDSAAGAIQSIAYAAGYASTQGLLLDHADYILGAACHRLVSTLGQELENRSNAIDSRAPLSSALTAPMVLVEMIRSIGPEVIVLIEDAIDEVLDAIDRFHANEEVCESLLTVLDKMMGAMLEREQVDGIRAQLPTPPSSFEADNDRDFDAFADWFKGYGSEKIEDEGGDTEGKAPAADDEKTATRTQTVTVAMLKKALPFLSHSSRSIRLRCLRLLNRGIEFLSRQGLKVEPLSVVDASWPLVMRRIGFSLDRSLPNDVAKVDVGAMDEQDFFVAVEAVGVVATVARYLVDYVGGKKMFEQAIPRLLLLLAIVERAETRTSGSYQSQPATFLLNGESEMPMKASLDLIKKTDAFRPIRPHSPLAILCERVLLTLDTLVVAMGPAITEADLFAFASHPTLLACLDDRQLESVYRLGHRFYNSLKSRNGALIWFILQATAGVEGFPKFLGHPDLKLDML